MKTTDIHPNPNNPRKITSVALERLKASIRRDPEFMRLRPIVVDADGMILGGNQRYAVICAMGMNEIPDDWVVRAADLTDEQRRRFVIVDNGPEGMSGEWDLELLAADWGDVDLEELGLEVPELEEIRDGETDPDETPDPPEEPVSKPGDIWVLGDHRLMCGDSTSAEDVGRLMGGESVDFCFTSPPYNVGIKYASYKDKAKRVEYLKFIENVVALSFDNMKHGRFLAWNIGVSPNTYPAWQVVTIEGCGFTFYRQIIWKKSGIPYPTFPSTLRAKRVGHYKPNYTHENVLFFDKDGDADKGTTTCPLCDGRGCVPLRDIPVAEGFGALQTFIKGDSPELRGESRPDKKYQNDVWQIAQSQATVNLETVGTRSSGLEKKGKKSHMVKEHPAAFPAELPRAIMTFLTGAGETVYEPFSGSGTTIIACEQLNRKCYAMEIEPRYVDVAVRRWEKFTGKSAVLERK
jgi:DNA modification methylase